MEELAKKIQEGKKTIGPNKYQALKAYNFDEMTAEDMVRFREERKMSVAEAKKEIAKYEAKFELTDYQKEQQKKYVEKILNPTEKKGKKLTAEILYKYFIHFYEVLYLKKYCIEKNSDSLENLKTLLFYFTRDDRFFKQKNIIENVNFGSITKTSKPSFEKGFIIIGNFGNGKTSTMNTFKTVFKESLKQGYDVPLFRSFTTQQLAEMFEVCKNAADKQNFWNNIKTGRIFFDDLKSESKASNYGTKNIMEEALQKREYKIDYVSINFANDAPGDIPSALLEIAEKYGNRVFDRIFSKWNIIEFKGKSFRGIN